jgi:adenosylcobyric acid synthase
VRGFLINKLRGDPALLGQAPEQLAARTGVPTLGVIPWLDGVAIDAEDSLALASDSALPFVVGPSDGADIDVAVVRFPRISNFTDLDALGTEPGVGIRWVEHPAQLGAPDLVVLPGTKSTVADLEWLRARGLADALVTLVASPHGPVVVGICGGLQMLGRRIEDPAGIERATEHTEGLGLLDVMTRFAEQKRTARRTGRARGSDLAVSGYQIHHGVVDVGEGAAAWFELVASSGGWEPEGVVDAERAIYGTTLHGVLENDAFRADLLAAVADRRSKTFAPGSVPFAEVRRRRADVVADALETYLDLDALWEIVTEGRPA